MQKRVLSGIRATGRLHLGNYLGAVKGMLELASRGEYETFFMVVDLHTLTTPYNKKTLKQSVRNIIIDYLAAGLDPEKSAIFVQSMVPEHLELSYYFSTITTVAKMQHLPTFKDKVKQYPENVNMSLLYYPILMAADILIYKAGLVPVGIDQEPHLEVTREIARRMNQDFGTDFPQPTRFGTKGEYVPSLAGYGKMSKSVEGSYINLTDSLDEIKAALARVVTDSGRGVVGKVEGKKEHFYEGENGKISTGVAALLQFVELFQGIEKRKEYEAQYEDQGIRYGDLKASLAESIYAELEPMQKRRAELEADPEYVDRVIAEGAEKARAVASQTVKEVREKMGLE